MSGWILYDSNNSGGSFWLTDENWRDLEAAGWHVEWNYAVEGRYVRYGGKPTDVSVESGRRYADTWEDATKRPVVGQPDWPDAHPDHQGGTVCLVAASYEEALALRAQHGGYFGTLAVSALKRGNSADELVAEFESITGQDASAEGCNCCGPPHSFEWHDDDGTTARASMRVTNTELVWS